MKRVVLTGITQNCRTVEELEAVKDSDAEAKELAENTTNFIKMLTLPETVSVGEGAFGNVFLYDFKMSVGAQSKIRHNAVKVITLMENGSCNQGKFFQTLYQKEMNASMVLNQLDKNNEFFPTYNGCVEVTKDFERVVNLESTENKEHVTVEASSVTFLYFTQKLDTDLFKFTKRFLAGTGPFFDQMNRVQLAINTMKGLVLMNKKYIHCDMKPENIMLKKISESHANNLFDLGLRTLETSPGHTYQSFIIDFGLIVPKGERCEGGTPGFLAQEFFTQDGHDNFDGFGVAMMMIDMELAAQELDNLSDVLAVSQSLKYKNKTYFKSKDRQDLNKMVLMKKIRFLLDSNGLIEESRKAIIELIPTIVSDLATSNKDQPFDSSDLTNFLFVNPHIYEALVMTAMSGFNYLSDFTKDINANIISLQKLASRYKTAISEEKDVETNTTNLQFAESFLRVQNSTKVFRRAYYDILFSMILGPQSRTLLSDGLSQIEKLLSEYKAENKADLKMMDEQAVEKAMANQNNRIDQSLRKSSKQGGDEEQSARKKGIVDQIMNSRRKRMGSLYDRRRLAL